MKKQITISINEQNELEYNGNGFSNIEILGICEWLKVIATRYLNTDNKACQAKNKNTENETT